MIYQISCITGSLPILAYKNIFENSGFKNSDILDKSKVILDLHKQLKKKLIALKLIRSVKSEVNGIDLSEIDVVEIKNIIQQVKDVVDEKYGMYFLYIGDK